MINGNLKLQITWTDFLMQAQSRLLDAMRKKGHLARNP